MFVCACVFVGVRVVLHTVSMSHDARCQVAILHPVQGGAVTTRWSCTIRIVIRSYNWCDYDANHPKALSGDVSGALWRSSCGKLIL